jgi:predicted SAM-dependent methyltransferase
MAADTVKEGGRASAPARLQLGTSRLEHLEDRVLRRFLDRTWVHLGDAEGTTEAKSLGHYGKMLVRSPVAFLRASVRGLTGRLPRQRTADPRSAELYGRTDFRSFYFTKGDRLEFEDESFDFIFSEHFFHHLFLDEAVALFRECHRMLRPSGVIRTIVPDADLRTYAPPEVVGFPDVRMSFIEPLKHKTRYSVYMLSEVLRLTGFEPVPLYYCDREGRHVQNDPGQMHEVYAGCPERELLFTLDYVIRPDSLIVDGIKM